MSGKKAFKELVKSLEGLGFEFARRNAKAAHVYTHKRYGDIAIVPGCDEHAARQILRKIERSLGVWKQAPKRNPEHVKERQAAERARLAAQADKLAAERQEILARRDSYLSGAGAVLTGAEIRAIEDRIEQIDRERRRIETLMTSIPAAGDHRGAGPRHRAGTR